MRQLSIRILITSALMLNCVIWSRPIQKRDTTNGLEVPPPEILKFMRRFGYLEPNPNDSESLYHESAIVEALKNIQKYGAIKQTGKLDNETLELFNKPRCGIPDIEGTPYYLQSSSTTQISTNHLSRNKRYVLGSRTWKKRRITYFIANWSYKITQQQVERDIAKAFNLWSQYSALKFIRVNNTAADIIVGFGSLYHGDSYPFDGAGNILAHAYYPYEMGSWGGDVHFDEDENWKENSTDLNNGVDFYSVALHELGHSLGLAHSSVYSSIMFPYYKGADHNVLDSDDTLAMYEMYLTKDLEENDNEIYSTKHLFKDSEESTTAINSSTERIIISSTTVKTFEGDYETIAQHNKKRYGFLVPTPNRNTSTTTTIPVILPKLSPPPNICGGKFDAVAVFNGTIFIFKQQYVWKITSQYTISNGYPCSIHEEFHFLPLHIKGIDAAYERYDGTIQMFSGANYWLYDPNTTEASVHNLTELLGSETILNKVDAVMMWPKNNNTYIFAGSKFWRMNDRFGNMDLGYPKSMRRWPGVPNNIDAATSLRNDKTYFFKDNLYWLYNNRQVRPERGYPRIASTIWLNCPPSTKPPLRNYNTTVSFI